MNINEQVSIIETQLSNFDSLMDKMQYLTEYFGNDSGFEQRALDIVRSNIARGIKE